MESTLLHEHVHHHHQITKLSHSINAIGPAPHQNEHVVLPAAAAVTRDATVLLHVEQNNRKTTVEKTCCKPAATPDRAVQLQRSNT
jgi:hypothetical protein